MQALTKAAIPDLVMVLNAEDVSSQRYAFRAGATRGAPEAEVLSLKNEALIQCFYYLLGSAEVLVIPAILACHQGVHRVVKIVTPDCIQPESSFACRQNELAIVLVRFGHHANSSAADVGELLNGTHKFLNNIRA